jgi:protein-serine/threonine kinase
MSDSEPQTPTPRYRGGRAASTDIATAERRNGDAVLNELNTEQNSDLPSSSQTLNAATIFKSNTIAPSPPPNPSTHPNDRASLRALDTSSRLHTSLDTGSGHSSPLSAGLRIRTDVPGCTVTAASAVNTARSSEEFSRAPATPIGIVRTPSIKHVLASSFGSNTSLGSAPNSVVSSPMLNAMADVTPLPSPLMSGDSPGPWRKLTFGHTSRETLIPPTADSALITANGESIASAIANQSKRRAYHGFGINESGLNSTTKNRDKNAGGHTRNRSLSEYVPEAVQNSMPRHITVSGSQCPTIFNPVAESDTSLDMHLRREPHLAVQRGLAPVPR